MSADMDALRTRAEAAEADAARLRALLDDIERPAGCTCAVMDNHHGEGIPRRDGMRGWCGEHAPAKEGGKDA